MSDIVFESLHECEQTCGFLSSSPPAFERCQECGTVSRYFGEFCRVCGSSIFDYVCPMCGATVVCDHPNTIGPRRPRIFCDEGEAS